MDVFNILITFGSVVSACIVLYGAFRWAFIPRIEKFLNKFFTENFENKLLSEIKNVNDKIDSYIKDHSKVTDTLQLGLQNLARDTIHEAYIYYMRKGEIDKYTLEVLKSLYKAYEKMHGNTFISSEMELLCTLKITELKELDKHEKSKKRNDSKNKSDSDSSDK